MSTCSLCDLPTPTPPVTEAGVEGTFCCRGCLAVARSLDDLPDGAADVHTDPTPAENPDVPSDAETAYFAVDGMHCTTCEAFLSLRGDETAGVYGVEANYGLETARVSYDPEQVSTAALPETLSGRGYQFRRPDDADSAATHSRQRETAQRLVVGGFLSMLVMPWYFVYLYPSYVGIETGILDVDATTAATLYLPMVIIAFATAGVLFYTGGPVLRGAWVSITTRQFNMDLLVAVAACAAFAYSSVALATGSIHLYLADAVADER